jgi:hypothetical protein
MNVFYKTTLPPILNYPFAFTSTQTTIDLRIPVLSRQRLPVIEEEDDLSEITELPGARLPSISSFPLPSVLKQPKTQNTKSDFEDEDDFLPGNFTGWFETPIKATDKFIKAIDKFNKYFSLVFIGSGFIVIGTILLFSEEIAAIAKKKKINLTTLVKAAL